MDTRKSVRIKFSQTLFTEQSQMDVENSVTDSASRNMAVSYSLRPLDVLKRRISLSKLKNACDRITTPRRKSSKPRTVVVREKNHKLNAESVRRLSESYLIQTNRNVGLQEPFDYCQSERRILDVKPTVRQFQNRPIVSPDSASPHVRLEVSEPKRLSLYGRKSRSNSRIEKVSVEERMTTESSDPGPQNAPDGIPCNVTPSLCESQPPATPKSSNRRARRSRTRSLERSTFSFELTPVAPTTRFPKVLVDRSTHLECNTPLRSSSNTTDADKRIKLYAQVKGKMIPLKTNTLSKEVLNALVKEATMNQNEIQVTESHASAVSDIVENPVAGMEENQNHLTSVTKSKITSKKSVFIKSTGIPSSAVKTASSRKTMTMKPPEKFYNSKWMLNRVQPSKEFKTPSKVQNYRRHTLASSAKIKLGSSLSSGSVSVVNTPIPKVGAQKPKVHTLGEGTNPKRFHLF